MTEIINEEDLICPITQEIFVDPVVLSDGITYERTAIDQWLTFHDTSPVTNEKIYNKHLTDNVTVRALAMKFRERLNSPNQPDSSVASQTAPNFGTTSDSTSKLLKEISESGDYKQIYKCNKLDYNDNPKLIKEIIERKDPEMTRYVISKLTNAQELVFDVSTGGNDDILLQLYRKGYKIGVPNKDGLCPIHLAARFNAPITIGLLVENGVNVDSRTRDNLTALHIAAKMGNTRVCRKLLELGGSINATTGVNKITALHLACKEGHYALAELLIKSKSFINSRAIFEIQKDGVTETWDLTPHGTAVAFGNIDIARMIESNRDFNWAIKDQRVRSSEKNSSNGNKLENASPKKIFRRDPDFPPPPFVDPKPVALMTNSDHVNTLRYGAPCTCKSKDLCTIC